MFQYHFGYLLTAMSPRANRKKKRRRRRRNGRVHCVPTSQCQPHSFHTTRGHEHHCCLSHRQHSISIHPNGSQQPSPSGSTSAAPHLHLPPSSQPLTMAATFSSVDAPSLPKHGSIIRAQQQAPPSIISASTVSRDASVLAVYFCGLFLVM